MPFKSFKYGIQRILFTFYFNIINTCIFLCTGTKKTFHEGKYTFFTKKWVNWNREYSCHPENYEQPKTEEEICQIIKNAKHLRVVGGGHSFNASSLTDGTLLSLDKYNKILNVDKNRKVVKIQAGLRLRDLGPELSKQELALPLLGSTNGQSIAGLVSTDLHGTGRVHGFLSEQTLSLRIVDSTGKAKTHLKDSRTFQAAVGGIGCAGVITEIELQCEDTYCLRKNVKLLDHHVIIKNIDHILAENDHVSLYYVGAIHSDVVRINLWNRTSNPCDRFPILNKLYTEFGDMVYTSFTMEVARFTHTEDSCFNLTKKMLPRIYNEKGHISEWYKSFPRKLFYLHDEIEYGIPYEKFSPCINELLDLLRKNKFHCMVEVRFTPNTSLALLGPGVGRPTCYIELASSLSLNSYPTYDQAEHIFLKYGGQPHLGKKTSLSPEKLREIYGDRFEQFKKVVQEQDPHGKFSNDFTKQLFDLPTPIRTEPVLSQRKAA